MCKVFIDHFIRVPIDGLPSKVLKCIQSEFRMKNPEYVKAIKQGLSTFNVDKYVYGYMTDDDTNSLIIMRGLFKELVEIFKSSGVRPSFTYKPRGTTLGYELKNFTPETLQEEAVKSFLKLKLDGVILAPTSSGKTLMGLYLAQLLNVTTTVVTWSKTHQMEWLKENKAFNFCPVKQLCGSGGLMGNKKTIGKLNFVMEQTLMRDGEYFDALNKVTGLWIIDEVQRGGADGANYLYNKFHGRRVGFSAGIKRPDGLSQLINYAVGPVCFQGKTKDTANKIPSEISIVSSNYIDTEYDTDEHAQFISRLSFAKERNELIVKRAMRKINQGKFVLILVERKEHVMKLKELFDAQEKRPHGRFWMAETSRKEALKYALTDEQVKFLVDFKQDKEASLIRELSYAKNIDYVIGTQGAFVGLSIKTFDHLIIATPASYGNLELFDQKIGRVERAYGRDEELKSLHGGEKDTPTVDYIADVKMPKFKKIAERIYKIYPRKMRLVKGN